MLQGRVEAGELEASCNKAKHTFFVYHGVSHCSVYCQLVARECPWMCLNAGSLSRNSGKAHKVPAFEGMYTVDVALS